METKNLDVVYFCRDGSNDELRYSLRSVEKNLPHNSVWIYGGKPKDIIPDHFVEIKQVRTNNNTKWDRVQDMFRKVCLNDDITENFILMNDDFFIMEKIARLNPYIRGSLYEHIVKIEFKYKNKPTEYSMQLRKATQALLNSGFEVNSYEVHVPMIINRKKLLEVMGAFPNTHATRSLYGNYTKQKPTKIDDVKVYKNNQAWAGGRFLSTQDEIWETSKVAKMVREKFNERGKYEAV